MPVIYRAGMAAFIARRITMAAFEHALKSQGISQVKLRVAGDNPRARHLYDAAGFRVTGVNMSKNIPTD
ncbi:hypothetical protein TUM17569_06940 [Klebsiella oxytoca]|nr:hypothetical protein TUM17569_06940 [Klebsiella oxytoca]